MSDRFIKYAAPFMALLFLIIAIRALANGQENLVAYQPQPIDFGVVVSDNNQNTAAATETFALPIDNAGNRVTKKPFGIFVTPRNSPVKPERFTGYHTGTDFETTPDEADAEISVYAISSGKVVAKERVAGYGGVLIISSEINGNPVTILYGHINLLSMDKKIGDEVAQGEKIGILGKGYSYETDGERKHLHLSIHKGSEINLRGYVSSKNQLSGWVDPMTVLSANP